MSPHTPVACCPGWVTPTSHNALARTQVIVEHRREEAERSAAHRLWHSNTRREKGEGQRKRLNIHGGSCDDGQRCVIVSTGCFLWELCVYVCVHAWRHDPDGLIKCHSLSDQEVCHVALLWNLMPTVLCARRNDKWGGCVRIIVIKEIRRAQKALKASHSSHTVTRNQNITVLGA